MWSVFSRDVVPVEFEGRSVSMSSQSLVYLLSVSLSVNCFTYSGLFVSSSVID